MAVHDLVQLYEQLKAEFARGNLSACEPLLSKAKIALTEFSFMLPQDQFDAKLLLIARDILEIGALYSLRAKDVPAFERYILQLKSYYHDFGTKLAPSQRIYTLLGLNLLRLLAQNRIAEFHTELELIDPSQLENVYIRHPIRLEQCLMEGSYGKVWNARLDVPAEEYLFFIDILVNTIRTEIASSCEKAYQSLPLNDALRLLYFSDAKEGINFFKSREWVIDETEKRVTFPHEDSESLEIPSTKLINFTLGYARELDRIV